MERKVCKRCGEYFTTKSGNTMCRYCISMVLDDEAAIRAAVQPKPKKNRKKRSQLELDVRAAKELGMSYGHYMAYKRDYGKGKI